jgi:hypothetical protein
LGGPRAAADFSACVHENCRKATGSFCSTHCAFSVESGWEGGTWEGGDVKVRSSSRTPGRTSRTKAFRDCTTAVVQVVPWHGCGGFAFMRGGGPTFAITFSRLCSAGCGTRAARAGTARAGAGAAGPNGEVNRRGGVTLFECPGRQRRRRRKPRRRTLFTWTR